MSINYNTNTLCIMGIDLALPTEIPIPVDVANKIIKREDAIKSFNYLSSRNKRNRKKRLQKKSKIKNRKCQ